MKASLMALTLLALVGLGATHWLSKAAEAQLGGLSQVSRLELRYTMGEGALHARFHLASGLAVDQRIDRDADIDRLLRATDIFAGGKARLLAKVESDEVTAWHLSVP